MQTYIIGIGQCGTSVAFDVISNLTGFVKSKDVTSSPQGAGNKAASNKLLELLNRDLKRREWLSPLRSWASRLWNGPGASRAFVLPRIAIIDGNPDNFVKDAFQNFRGAVHVDEESNDNDLRQLADLITTTNVLDLGGWKSGCANGIVGERVAFNYLPPPALRDALGVDGLGNLNGPDGPPFPVAVFLVVSSGGGATGSGGGVYLGQTDALLAKTGPPSQPRHTLALNVVVLPSTTTSLDNRRYALNAGRALARHGNIVRIQNAGEGGNKPSSTMLFSNPRDEGDSRSLQQLNNYIAEFAIRVGNFTYPGSVAPIARDVDVRELLRFLSGKVSVLAMSHRSGESWDEPEIEAMLVERAFVDMYGDEVDTKKPHGLSVEDATEVVDGNASTGGLSTASSAIFVVGLPPKFKRRLSLKKIGAHIKTRSGSPLRSGIRAFSYGTAKDLELTVLLRYRAMSACPLARHFVGQYIGEEWNFAAAEVPETDYLRARMEQDDDDAEAFEEIVADLDELGGLDFSGYTVRQQGGRRSGPETGAENREES